MNLLNALFFISTIAGAIDPNQTKLIPEELENVGIDKSVIGSTISLDTEFVNEDGESYPLSDYFIEDKPVLLSMVYYNCPGLCNLHMNGAGTLFEEMELKAGQDFNWLLVSMDSNEGSDLAVKKKISYLDKFNVEGAEEGWKFLTSKPQDLEKLTKELGFSFKWDPQTKQFAHSAAFYAISSDGLISQIVPGVGFDKKTVRLSLVEAAKGKIGSTIDQLLLFCFRFDPSKNKYTLYAYNIMRAAGLITVIILSIVIVPMWLKEREPKVKKND